MFHCDARANYANDPNEIHGQISENSGFYGREVFIIYSEFAKIKVLWDVDRVTVLRADFMFICILPPIYSSSCFVGTDT
jgi:hypothetical protein